LARDQLVIVVRDAEVSGRVVDVRIDGDRVVEVATRGRSRGDEVIDAAGGALLPGLHDHHMHVLALAAARRSIVCGPPAVSTPTELAASLAQADRDLGPGAWLRGVGYHESVAGDLDRDLLDAIVPTRPVRVQHRSGHGWILNSAALRAIGPPDDLLGIDLRGVERDHRGAPTGRLYGMDEWLAERVPHEPLDLASVGVELASYGVTGLTDATPTTEPARLDALAEATTSGALPQRVVVTGSVNLPIDAAPTLPRGPVKIVVADHALPSVDDLTTAIGTAHAVGRSVAVHCVTRVALLLALAAWDEVGARPGDRIEHGAVLPLEQAGRVAALGLTVITQPGFIALRGDTYLDDVDADDRAHLWRCGSLVAAGVAVAGSTDAPFGHPDPWRAIAAAVERRTPRGAVLGPGDCLAPLDALRLFLTPLERPGGVPRRVVVGARADLCLLVCPLAAALAAPSSQHVRLVLRAGAVIHRS
jgi:predicted amidohydrolase YtcJ